MATTLEALVVSLEVDGVSEVAGGMKKVASAAEDIGETTRRMGGNVAAGGLSLIGMAFAAQQAFSAISQLTRTLANVSGVQLAGTYQRISVGFTALLGSEQAAKGLLAELRDIGANTDFRTADLTGFARGLLAAGDNAQQAAQHMRILTDTAATLALSTGEVGELTRALSHIKMRPQVTMESILPLITAGVNIDKVVSLGLGRKIGEGQGLQTLESMKTSKASEAIYAGLAKMYGGGATKAAGTLPGLIQNIGEAIENVMLPTGNRLIPALSLMAEKIKLGAEWIGNLNEKTGGKAGLTVFALGLYKGITLTIGGLRSATDKVNMFTLALERLAGVGVPNAAGTAAGTVGAGVSAAEGAAAGVATASLWTRLKAIPAALRSLPAAIKGAGGLRAFGAGLFKGVGGKAAGLAKGLGPQLLAYALDWGLSFIGNKVGGRTGATLNGIGTGLSTGALAGGIIGSMVPILGTGIGALIGGTLGAIINGVNTFRAYKPGDNSAEERTAKAAEKIAENTNDLKGSAIGGGSRTRNAISNLQLEAQIARLLAPG